MRNMVAIGLALAAVALFPACETETESCSEGPDCASLGTAVDVCCVDDGTDSSCRYTTSDSEVFNCDTYAIDDGMGESCDQAAADLAAYCAE